MLMHEALHVMHYRQIQRALNVTDGNMPKAYEYLKKNGYTQEFLKIFFVGVDDNQIFHSIPTANMFICSDMTMRQSKNTTCF